MDPLLGWVTAVVVAANCLVEHFLPLLRRERVLEWECLCPCMHNVWHARLKGQHNLVLIS